ncbi:Bug family tripartite tricarboxylate transporter substrate binding protein [Paracidovorax citrulli]
MSHYRRILAGVAGVCTTLAASIAGAQPASWPTRPISIVVPNPPGGVVDTSARLVADALAKQLGQAVVVDNRPGGSGNIAYQIAARAPKDGYTLLASYSAYHVGNPSMFSKLPWSQKDLAPVALLTVATNVITVNPSVPANTLQELIAYLKQNPGEANYASQGNGSLSHIGTELFDQMTGTKMVHVPYKGSGPAMQDMLAGQVQVFITTPPSVMGHVQTGKLRALAVTSKTRHPMLPNVPTTAEAGLPGFELEAWMALFAPAGTPPETVAKLTASVKKALEQPETRARAEGAGIEARYLDPAGLAALVAKDTEYWGRIIKARNITAD